MQEHVVAGVVVVFIKRNVTMNSSDTHFQWLESQMLLQFPCFIHKNLTCAHKAMSHEQRQLTHLTVYRTGQ